MKQIRDALRMVVISFETVFALATFLLCQQNPKIFVVLGDSLTSDSDVTKWLPAIPLALSVYCFIDLIWKIITPLSSSNKELHEWPDFWRLKMRCYYSLVLSAIYAGIAVSLWIFSKTMPHEWVGLLFTLSLGLSLINAGCMIFASYTIRIIMEPRQ